MQGDTSLVEVAAVIGHLGRLVVTLAVDNAVLGRIGDGSDATTARILSRGLAVVLQDTGGGGLLSDSIHTISDGGASLLVIGLEELLEVPRLAIAGVLGSSLGHLVDALEVLLHELAVLAIAALHARTLGHILGDSFGSLEADLVGVVRGQGELLRVAGQSVLEAAIGDGRVLLSGGKVMRVGDVEDRLGGLVGS